MIIPFKKIDPNARTPFHANYGDAGADLFSATDIEIPPHAIGVVTTGVAAEIPYGFVGYINPRSSMAMKGIGIMNAPGTIDSGYRGEIKVLLVNHTAKPYQVNFGDKIAQMVIHRYETVDFEEVAELQDSMRGTSGFGSTGK
jgi:dUTP pyrophosphatase